MRSLCVLALALCLSAVRADEEVFSGPQEGEKLTSFKVKQLTGAQAGKKADPIQEADGKPTAVIFVHETSRLVLPVVRSLEHFAAQWSDKGLVTQIVWLTDKAEETEKQLSHVVKSANMKTPIGISEDGIEGPGNYGLNRKVKMTVLVAKDNKVVANFALVQPGDKDVPAVLAAMAKVVDQKAPTAEEIQAATGRDRMDKPPQRGEKQR